MTRTQAGAPTTTTALRTTRRVVRRATPHHSRELTVGPPALARCQWTARVLRHFLSIRSNPEGRITADLHVQAPTKFQMSINLKTAKALGLTIPESFLLRPDVAVE